MAFTLGELERKCEGCKHLTKTEDGYLCKLRLTRVTPESGYVGCWKAKEGDEQ